MSVAISHLLDAIAHMILGHAYRGSVRTRGCSTFLVRSASYGYYMFALVQIQMNISLHIAYPSTQSLV